MLKHCTLNQPKCPFLSDNHLSNYSKTVFHLRLSLIPSTSSPELFCLIIFEVIFFVIIITFPRFFSISFSVDIAACGGVIMALQKKPLIGEQVIFFT